MEKESPTKSASSGMIRTILFFLFGGFILTGAEIICWLTWTSIHDNQLDVFRLIALAPSFAFVFTLSYYTYSVIVGTMVAAVSQWIWGRVPFYSLIVMLPLCVLALYEQMPHKLSYFNHADFLWRSSLQLLPVLVGCWWLNNRASKS